MPAVTEPLAAPRRAVIGLGANLGDLDATLDAACAAIAALPHSRWLGVSGRWCSRPVDSSGPDYLNAVARLATRLDAHALLGALRAIEARHGRARPFPNARAESTIHTNTGPLRRLRRPTGTRRSTSAITAATAAAGMPLKASMPGR